MIGLNTLLEEEKIDPTEVKLVRHQDTRWPGRPTPYHLWQAADGRFELYQRIQRRPVFRGATFLASFVATPLDETLFVGIYAVDGVGMATAEIRDPISDEESGGKHLYNLTNCQALSDYRGRLVVDWGQGYRSWVQLAQNQNKPIIEIRRSASEPPFPGFLDFHARLSTLAAVPASWRIALSAVKGVYLLNHPSTGKQYVGSAQGSDGFWGRWEQYVASGHGGNRMMQDIPEADYSVSVLEVASSSADADFILRMEERWKKKLLSRGFGLNAN